MSEHVRLHTSNAPQEASANDGQQTSFSAELERLLFSGLRAADLNQIRALLEDEMFRPKPGLTSAEAAALGYRRVRFLATALKIKASELRDDPSRLFALHDWVGLVDGVAGAMLSIHYCQALGTLVALGEGRPELAALLAELERMDSVGVFLATELGCGSDLPALETEAVYDAHRREFILSSPSREASKFMSNTALAVPKLGIVMARLISQNEDHGIFPFVVRLRGADGRPCLGVSIAPLSEKPGYALDNALTAFDRLRVPKAQLLLGIGSVLHDDGYFESHLPNHRRRFPLPMDPVQTSRICFASTGAAMMRAATWICVRYTAQRLASAPGSESIPLLRYRNVQRDVFGALALAYALTFAVRFLQGRFRTRTVESAPELFRVTATLKAVVMAEAGEALPRLSERCGALGVLSANRILDYWNQLQSWVTEEDDNQLLLLKAGRQLLESPESPLSVIPGPAVSAALDPQEAVFLFAHREGRLKQELKESIGEARRRTAEPLAIWNDHVNLTIALAKAYGTRLLAECFRVAITDCVDEAGKRALRTLFSLWALDRVDCHAGWFLSQGCISREAVEHLASDRDRLCAGIEPHALELVNAFGIDNTLLRAPIAEDDYLAAYDALVTTPTTRYKSGAFGVGGVEGLEIKDACGAGVCPF
jgi:acyl-CoA oxidase